ncbi:uncharacterized protein LOC122139691 [Tachysurus ichikawai]
MPTSAKMDQKSTAARSDARRYGLQASDDGDSYQHVPVGILSLENEDVALQPLSLRLHPSSVGIILEGNVVMDNFDNIPQAMCKKELKGKILAVTNQLTM